MRKISLLFIALTMASCNSTKNTTSLTLDKFVIENLIRFNSEDIKDHYPDANVYEALGVFEEGTEELPYSVLYPDTPNELNIT
jgi:regulator of sirC expression with transglutaminase-like and TPR domain